MVRYTYLVYCFFCRWRSIYGASYYVSSCLEIRSIPVSIPGPGHLFCCLLDTSFQWQVSSREINHQPQATLSCSTGITYVCFLVVSSFFSSCFYSLFFFHSHEPSLQENNSYRKRYNHTFSPRSLNVIMVTCLGDITVCVVKRQ